jgi:carbonic anhydrase
VYDELLAANRRYATDFRLGGIPARAATGFALVTCMDSRIEPLVMLGLGPGDAKIMRNAGGRVTPDVLRSLVLATAYLGVTGIAVMHHTGCAMTQRSDDDIHADIPAAAGWEFLTMADPDGALAADVAAVRECKALTPGTAVEGWRYDVETGLIDRVLPSA